MREGRSLPPAQRGGRVIGTDALRILRRSPQRRAGTCHDATGVARQDQENSSAPARSEFIFPQNSVYIFLSPRPQEAQPAKGKEQKSQQQTKPSRR